MIHSCHYRSSLPVFCGWNMMKSPIPGLNSSPDCSPATRAAARTCQCRPHWPSTLPVRCGINCAKTRVIDGYLANCQKFGLYLNSDCGKTSQESLPSVNSSGEKRVEVIASSASCHVKRCRYNRLPSPPTSQHPCVRQWSQSAKTYRLLLGQDAMSREVSRSPGSAPQGPLGVHLRLPSGGLRSARSPATAQRRARRCASEQRPSCCGSDLGLGMLSPWFGQGFCRKMWYLMVI
jgi:hypothetical protein